MEEKDFIRNSGYMKRKELDLAVKRFAKSIETQTLYGRACLYLIDKLSKLLNTTKPRQSN